MAQIYFGIQTLAVPLDQTFEVGVFLDTHQASIAALEGTISVPAGVELVDVRSGNSLVNLWLEAPAAGSNVVNFSGVVPGGYRGEQGELFTLVVKARSLGEQQFSANDVNILLNDGAGTAAEYVPAPLSVTVVATGEVEEYVPLTDTEPPEVFVPVLVDPSQFGQWSLIFLTQDKGSGVAFYEVKEGNGAWQVATSPYTLREQKMRHKISVRATDGAGNERVVILPAAHPLPWVSSGIFWGILAAVIVVIALTLATRRIWTRKFLRKVRRSR